MKKTKRSNLKTYEARLIKRLNNSKVNVEVDSVPAPTAGDNASQAQTIETDETTLPRRVRAEEPESVNGFLEEVSRDFLRGAGEQLLQEVGDNSQDDPSLGVITIELVNTGSQDDGGSITIDDSFMEDGNNQDYSNDTITITITDDSTVDDSQEENEVIYLTSSPAESQVSSVPPSLNETVEEEICPVCHETFGNIEKDGKTLR